MTRPHGQEVKTLPSQGKIRGSIPLGATTKKHGVFAPCFYFFKVYWGIERVGSCNIMTIYYV